MIDDEIRNMEPMTGEAALKWCGESAYQSLCEDTAQNIVDNLPEDLQSMVLEWAAERLYACLVCEGRIVPSEKDFGDYEYYDIETDNDGERFMHIFGYCWHNDGRVDDETSGPRPYTVTEYTNCRVPLKELVACKDASERWDLICDCEAAVQQYEGDYTWDGFIAAGYGDPGLRNGCMSTGDNEPSFDNYLHYENISIWTPDGSYYYMV